MRRVRPSCAASVRARFTAVSVLPSPGAVEVTVMMREPGSLQE